MNGRQAWNKGTKRVVLWDQPMFLPIEPKKGTVRWAFTRGQCHSLAYALHELTGWPIYVLCYEEPMDGEPVGEQWRHAVVQAPDGRFVDIEGAWRLDENEAWSGSHAWMAMSRQECEDVLDGYCDVVNVKAAKPFAEAVLAAL